MSLAILEKLVSRKLGRCAKCMRAARNGTLIAGGSCVITAISGSSKLLALNMAVAATFMCLTIAHSAAYHWRERQKVKRLNHQRLTLGLAVGIPRRLFIARAAMALGGALTFTGRVLADAASPPKCECYFSADCSGTSRGVRCDYTAKCDQRNKPDEKIGGKLICGSPINQPKCDGMCKATRTQGANWGAVDVRLVGKAFDLYLQAYRAAGLTGGGPPSPALLRMALSIPIPDAWHVELQDATHNVFDVLLGWDFMLSLDTRVCFAEMPAVNGSALHLIDAARLGLVNGLLQNNSAAVVAPIQSFWAGSETYQPLHLGRCYPHGHPEITDVSVCQVIELQTLLQLLLAGR